MRKKETNHLLILIDVLEQLALRCMLNPNSRKEFILKKAFHDLKEDIFMNRIGRGLRTK